MSMSESNSTVAGQTLQKEATNAYIGYSIASGHYSLRKGENNRDQEKKRS